MNAGSAIDLLRCLSPRRLWNLVRVLASYKLSHWSGRSIVWGLPYTVTIEPTNRCNLQCPECPSGNGEMTRLQGSMSLDKFESIIDDLSPEMFYLQLFFQGEPFINKQLLDMVRCARGKRIYVSVSTNAHFIQEDTARQLVESGLHRLIVSIDGTSEESYRDYRVGGSLRKVLTALEHLKLAREAAPSCRMEVSLQFLVTRQNEHEIPMLREYARRYNARPVLKTIQVSSIESARRFLPENERYRRYRIVNDPESHSEKLLVKSKMKNRCVRLWERSVITWDGVVVPCCFDKDAEYPLGDIGSSSFREIWQSQPYHDFRRCILEDRSSIPMCMNCTEGLRVYR